MHADHRIIPREHNQRVLTMADALLAGAGVRPADLDAIAFGRGPGSFTGLRIAAGIAQGMALGLGIPVLPVSTLEVLAVTALTAFPDAPGAVCALGSRAGELYLGVYAVDQPARGAQAPVVRALTPEAGIAATALDLPSAVDERWVFCGDAIATVRDPIDQRYGERARLHPELLPDAAALVRLALARLARGEGIDAADAIPSYLQGELPWRKTGDDRRR